MENSVTLTPRGHRLLRLALDQLSRRDAASIYDLRLEHKQYLTDLSALNTIADTNGTLTVYIGTSSSGGGGIFGPS